LAAGLTQAQLAERAGLSARGISDLERGLKQRPCKDTLDLLIAALGLSPADQAHLRAAVRWEGRQRRNETPTLVALPPQVVPADAAHLPIQPTSFIGRTAQVGELRDLLLNPTVRLVTVTGPGGIGKTRLALEMARTSADGFPDGIVVVQLASIVDPQLVLPTIAFQLKLKESPGYSTIQVISRALRARRVLLLLDNLEHLLDAAPALVEILASSPAVKVLVTSRELLRVSGEHVYEVPSLTLPESSNRTRVEEARASEAVQLFIERARAVKSSFRLDQDNAGSVAAICRRLDGLPLAIELAAARIRVFSPRELLGRLDDQLNLLVGGARDLPSRQQTLRATIQWSYDLLSEEERALFRRLSVFAGAFDLAAAQAIGATERSDGNSVLERIDSLLAKSLIRTLDAGEEPAFTMLETIREFGRERLREAGEESTILEAHASYFLSLAETVVKRSELPEDAKDVDQLAPFVDNLRTALDHLIALGDVERSLRLAAVLAHYYWLRRGRSRKGLERLAVALDLSRRSLVSLSLRAWALDKAAWIAWLLCDYDVAAAYYSEALAMNRDLENHGGVSRTMIGLAMIEQQRGNYAEAIALFEEAVAIQRRLDDEVSLLDALIMLASGNVDLGNVEAARPLLVEVLPMTRRQDNWFDYSFVRCMEGRILTLAGDLESAQGKFDECLAVARRIQADWYVIHGLYALGYLACRRGDLVNAQHLLEEGLSIARIRDWPSQVYLGLDQFTVLATADGDRLRAARLAGACATLRKTGRTLRYPMWRTCLKQANTPIDRPEEDPEAAAAWDEGSSLALDEAVEYALECGS
jgi:predicted ATPase/transcriptional regulator with XRE-family HTH domain